MDIETAIDVCKGAIRNKARVVSIVATDDAESERSVHFAFSPAQSEAILAAVLATLQRSNP